MRFLINATLFDSTEHSKIYEFILSGPQFFIIECFEVKNHYLNHFFPLTDPFKALKDAKFRLNHLRVEPTHNEDEALLLFSEYLKNHNVSNNSTMRENLFFQLDHDKGSIMFFDQMLKNKSGKR